MDWIVSEHEAKDRRYRYQAIQGSIKKTHFGGDIGSVNWKITGISTTVSSKSFAVDPGFGLPHTSIVTCYHDMNIII